MSRIEEKKSIEELAEEIGDFDTVVTAKSSIASKLSEKVDAEVGTPKQLVGPEDYRKDIFFELAEDSTWKAASYKMRNAESCLRHTGSLEGLEKEGFSRKDIEEIRKAYREVENPYKRADKTSLEGKVAVLDEERIEYIWQNTLLDDYDNLGIFKEKFIELERFYTFQTGGDIARSIAENIKSLEKDEVGIIVPQESNYRPLIESELEARNIEYTKDKKVSESEELRTFILLGRISISRGRIRAEDVKPIVKHLDICLPRSQKNKLLSEINNDEVDELRELLNVLRHMEFSEAAKKLGDLGLDIQEIEEVLASLGLRNSIINDKNIKKLEYYLESFNPSERSQKGVTITGKTSLDTFGKKYVFIVGLGSEWNQEIKQKAWIRDKEVKQRVLKEFKLLLQPGKENYYFLNESAEEKPCHHLTEILESAPTDFEDLEPTKASPKGRNKKEGFKKKVTNINVKEEETLSQSSLNSFVLSPRIYYFDQLVEEAEELRKVKGRLFHDFAEFYVNYPDYADEKNITDFMIDRIKPYADEFEIENIKTEIEVGVKNIKRYIRRENVEPVRIADYETKSLNIFSEAFEKPLRFELTELKFRDEEMGAKGKIDFIKDENHLVDYKSGRIKSEEKTIKKSKIQLYDKERFPDFQPIMYLAHHRKVQPGEELKFTFFHFLNNLGDHVKGNGDIDENLVTVEYKPESFSEYLASDEAFDQLVKGVAKSNDRRKTLEKLGRERYKQFILNTRVPETYDKREILETEFANRLNKFAKSEVGDYKYVEKGVQSAAKKIVDFRLNKFFKNDLDRFEEFLDQKIEELNKYKKEGKFPILKNPDELPKQDMLVR